MGEGEHVRVVGMLLMLGDQQVNGFLWDTDLSDRCLCLGAGEGQFSVRIFDILLADGDGSVCNVEVAPQEGGQLALAQPADQFQIEHGQQSPFLCGVKVSFDVFRLEDLHFKFLHFRCDAVLGRIAEDQALFYGTVQCVVEHQVQAADGGAAETRIAVPAFASGAAALHQLLCFCVLSAFDGRAHTCAAGTAPKTVGLHGTAFVQGVRMPYGAHECLRPHRGVDLTGRLQDQAFA